MKWNSLLHSLIPREDKFFTYFEKNAENLLNAARIFKEMMSENVSKEERAQKIRRIEELEHKGDEATHQIFSELSGTFITPFDREDIHQLASKMDDVLDLLNGAATRIILYRIDVITPELEQMSRMVYDQVVALHTAIPFLRDMRNTPPVRDQLVHINSIENEADDVFERAIANLFDTCTDPIALIKRKELLVSLETATDACEDAANVIESILVKNA